MTAGEILKQLSEADLRRRLDELEGERDATMVLLRAARRLRHAKQDDGQADAKPGEAVS